VLMGDESPPNPNYLMDKKEKAKAARRAREKKARDQLSDSYVRKLLPGKNPSGLKKSDYSMEMVEVKRIHLAIRRILLNRDSADAASETVRRLHCDEKTPTSTQPTEAQAKKQDS
jgi:hypothetical protein